MNSKKTEEDLPSAKIKDRLRISPIWLVPILAAIAAGWLIYQNVHRAGPEITILFADANGVQPNQTILKYRGVRVGEVQSLQLTPDAQHVEIKARLERSAENLARDGSRFWIVRPQLGSGGLKALETIVSGPYIQIQPSNGRSQKKFVGDEQAPRVTQADGKFEIVVTTPQIHTLSIGSPVYYRGVEVGAVSYFLLSEDSTQVNVHLLIETNFAPLVRMDSKFWNAGGINFDLKFIGLSINAENFKSLIIGGIAFATPSNSGPLASPGTVFPLAEKSEEKWEKWSPEISIVNSESHSPESSPSALLMNSVNPAADTANPESSNPK
jgi:paraquat-inducible protein B